MILFGILKILIELGLGASSIIGNIITIQRSPEFYFQWVSDVAPYFECLRYIIPLDQLIPLFMAIISITVLRIVIALIKMFFGKVIPIW